MAHINLESLSHTQLVRLARHLSQFVDVLIQVQEGFAAKVIEAFPDVPERLIASYAEMASEVVEKSDAEIEKIILEFPAGKKSSRH